MVPDALAQLQRHEHARIANDTAIPAPFLDLIVPEVRLPKHVTPCGQQFERQVIETLLCFVETIMTVA